MRWLMAVMKVNGLAALPVWRRACVARLNFTRVKSRPPTMALMAPVVGSIATSAADGSPRALRWAAMAASAAF